MGNSVMYNSGVSIVLAIDHTKIGTNRMIVWLSVSSLIIPAEQFIRVGDVVLIIAQDVTLTWADLDTGVLRVGTDYFVYACQPLSGSVPVFKISQNATYPSGYTALNSRQIGGFHTLCVSAGTLAGNRHNGFLAGAILPLSIWDLDFYAKNGNNSGMVYDPKDNLWKDIYIMSGTGTNSASVYGATITDSRNWMDFVDDLGAVGKQLLDDHEFQLGAAGGNEGTNINGSADPVTTGGHSDTNGRRMISDIGCEDMAGVMWQWLRTQSTQWGGTGGWQWVDQTGGKGKLYLAGDINDVKLLAGGVWHDGANCGSRARYASNCRWSADSCIGGRGRAESVKR